jgi:hypothetical protein
MGRASFGDLYADFIAKSPGKASRTLAELRRRRDELAAGDPPRLPSESLDSVTAQIGNYLRGFRMASRCEDCGKPLEDPASVERGVGPDCWARRQRAGKPLDPDGAF